MRATYWSSSRLLTDWNVVLPHGSAVDGSRRARFSAAGLKSAGLIVLFTNGARKAICRPLLQAGDVMALKSSAGIAAVGTHAMLSAGRTRVGVNWSPPKKNSLSCI